MTREELTDSPELSEEEAAEAAGAAVFDQWASAVAEAVEVLKGLVARWPTTDPDWEVLLSTLEHAAQNLDGDRGRSRSRLDGRSPLRVPSSATLLRYHEARQEARRQEEEAAAASWGVWDDEEVG